MLDMDALDYFLEYADENQLSSYLPEYWRAFEEVLNEKEMSKNWLKNLVPSIGIRAMRLGDRLPAPQSVLRKLNSLLAQWESLPDGGNPDFLGGN